MVRFVIDRQMEIGEIDELGVELAMRRGIVVEPPRDGRPDASRAGAGNHGVKSGGHGVLLALWSLFVTQAKLVTVKTSRKKARK
jgi:hypothetical protein